MVLAGKGTFRDEDWKAEHLLLSDNDRYIVAVCDGMGGHNAGEVASEDVAVQLSKFFYAMPQGMDKESMLAELWQWQLDEHEYLNQRGEDDPSLMQMGTTLVSLFLYEGRLYWGNCGDSRLYRFRKGILEQLSQDHSLYAQTHNFADKHVITNCMGGGCPDSFIEIEEITDQHRSGDVYMLCSDGLTDMLSDKEIAAVLNIGGRAKELTMAACEAGGMDNVSVCIAEIS